LDYNFLKILMVDSLPRHGNFSIFKMAAVWHLGFVVHIRTTHEEYFVVFVALQNMGGIN